MTNQFTQVTKEEFFNFLSTYPKTLKIDENFMVQPPALCYHDFGRFTPEESMVAYCQMSDDTLEFDEDECINYIRRELKEE